MRRFIEAMRGGLKKRIRGSQGFFELTTTVEFDAAHKLPDYDGPCGELHGHRWKVVVNLKSKGLDDKGMVCDFTLIKGVIKKYLDHKYVNDVEDLSNPTAENLARWIVEKIEWPDHIVEVKATVWETPNNSVSYSTAQ